MIVRAIAPNSLITCGAAFLMNRPRDELHEYSFSTIAKQAMRSYIGNELKKADRRIKTISLDAIVGDLEGITLMDMVTYDSYHQDQTEFLLPLPTSAETVLSGSTNLPTDYYQGSGNPP